jgi:hypothetical protein
VTVVISASGSVSWRRSVQSVSAESLPPLQDSAKRVRAGDGAVLSPESRASRGRWVVCPDMKTSASSEGGGPATAAARTALPPRADVRSAQGVRPGSSPVGASQLRDSAGLHRTSPPYTRREYGAGEASIRDRGDTAPAVLLFAHVEPEQTRAHTDALSGRMAACAPMISASCTTVGTLPSKKTQTVALVRQLCASDD